MNQTHINSNAGNRILASPEQRTSAQLASPALVALAWISTLAASALPDIVWQEFVAAPAIWLLQAKVLFLGGLIALSIAWKPARALRQYFIILLLLSTLMSKGVLNWVETALGGMAAPPFSERALAMQVRGLGLALILIAVLFLMKRRRSEFFLIKGQLDAPVETAKRPGVNQRLKWNRLVWALSACILLGILGYLLIAGRPSTNLLAQVLSILPVVVPFAASNAFNEEMRYRVGLIAPLHTVAGKQQAIFMSALFFGLDHYLTGVPGGLVGVALTGFLGWLLGKSLLETRGVFWAWFIHFLGDAPIFLFIATGSI